ncbi:hypothetical protein Y032_0619g721 [Ancylostoma ceylanicum]|nr:hypothetical protein Y032_0619g721 [Ancylostoma ceylanicum]
MVLDAYYCNLDADLDIDCENNETRSSPSPAPQRECEGKPIPTGQAGSKRSNFPMRVCTTIHPAIQLHRYDCRRSMTVRIENRQLLDCFIRMCAD